jgi:FkbM family methyltransferase
MSKCIRLEDGTPVHCLLKAEAMVLDHHVAGYLTHGITIGPSDVVFDVGANVGVFALRALQRGPAVRVFAFEPIPPIFDVLEKNQRAFGQNRLTALACGAGRENTSVDITYYPRSPALSTAHSSFWDEHPSMLATAVHGNTQNAPKSLWYAPLVPRALSGLVARMLRRGGKTYSCPIRTISSVLEEHQLDRIDLLKIDCEGAEWDALCGIRDEHWPLVKQVVVEVHDVDGRLDAVSGLLTGHGFDFIATEKEKGFEATQLTNLFARRA